MSDFRQSFGNSVCLTNKSTLDGVDVDNVKNFTVCHELFQLEALRPCCVYRPKLVNAQVGFQNKVGETILIINLI